MSGTIKRLHYTSRLTDATTKVPHMLTGSFALHSTEEEISVVGGKLKTIMKKINSTCRLLL